MSYLKGWNPNSLRNMLFCQEVQQKGPKEDGGQVCQGRARQCRGYEALIKPEEVKPKIPKGGSHRRDLPTSLMPSLLPRVSGSSSQRPRLKPWLSLWLQLQLRLRKVPRPPGKLQCQGLCWCGDGRTGVTLAAVCLGLVVSCALAEISLQQGLSLTHSVHVNSIDKTVLTGLQGEVRVDLVKLMDLKSI